MRKVIFAVLFAILFLVGATNVRALSLAYNDVYYVGTIVDGIPSSPQLELGYLADLITVAAGATATIGTEYYDRSASELAPLYPLLNPLDPTTYLKEDNSVTTHPAPFGGWVYVLGKYDADNAGCFVWLVNVAQNDSITIPALFFNPTTGEYKYGLSHTFYALAAGPPPNPPVPEPVSVLLLGLGLVGVAGFRRMVK